METKQLTAIDEINKINHPFLQDLVWLIYLPSLQSESIPKSLVYELPKSNFPDLIDWCNQIDPSTIPTLKSYLPLGKYAERLMEFYFRLSEKLELLKCNVQLSENSITIGELDFLVQEKASKRFIHLEFAIKYYLKVTRNEKTIYLGPSTKDWMQRKLKKLIEMQTKHSINHKNLFPKEYQNVDFIPKLLLKGALFYPLDEKANLELNEGWWLSIKHVEQLRKTNCDYALITQKQFWIFPFRNDIKSLSFPAFKKICSLLLESRDEVMVVRVNKNHQFIDRGFMVRKDWPD